MKKIAYLITGILILSTSIVASQSTKGSKTVATVNSEKITKNELDRAADVLAPRTFFHATMTKKKRKKVEKEALKNLIERKLLLQYAKKLGIKATKGERDSKEYEIRKKFKNKKSFAQALQKSKFTYEIFKKEIESDIILSKFYQKKIKASLTDKYLKKYYEKNKFKFKEPSKIKLRIIYAKNDPRDPKGKTKAKKKIQKAYKKIKSGEKFADVAAKYSDAMSRIKGGGLSYMHKGLLDPEVDKVAFDLKPGQMSGIIQSDKGFYLILTEDIKPSKQISFKKSKDKLRKSLIAKTENKRKKALLKRLKKSAKIKIKIKL